MVVGLFTAKPTPVFDGIGFGTVGAEFANATVRFVDCVDAPKPSPTVRRKKSDAPDTENAGAVNVATRWFALVSVTFATAQFGAHGVPVLSVCTHWYEYPAARSPSGSFPGAATWIVTVVPTGRDDGLADGAAS